MPFYAVRTGRKPGVYNSWNECQAETTNFPKARFKKFNSFQEAEEFAFPNKEKGHSSVVVNLESHLTSSASASSETMQPPLAPPAKVTVLQDAAVSPFRTLTGADASVISSSQPPLSPVQDKSLLSLKGVVAGIKVCHSKMRNYISQAEDLLNQASPGRKRSLSSSSSQSTLLCSPAKRLNSQQSPGGAEWVSVYTDGCCHDNGRGDPRAGIGVYWGPGNERNLAEKLYGRQTNNRAEIYAAHRAIEQAKEMKIQNLVIFTDSQFLISCITKWIQNWKKRGWKTTSGKAVINREELENLDSVMQGINVRWEHVKGHSGVEGNEMADQLANEGARK